MKINKQGVELEFNVVDQENYFRRSHELHSRMERKCHSSISSRFYFDDEKPEFPSDPYPTLPELEEHLSYIIDRVSDIAKEEKCYLSFLGCYPYFSDFASGHIHTSIDPWSENAWLLMRRKLFNAQPIIALLSANSPIREKQYIGSDVRLMLSSWSSPVNYEAEDSSHWMALAKGRHTPTLECRIPSSAPLFQILAIANLIRVLLENEDEELPTLNTLETWNRVVKYGSEAIVDILLPKTVTYHGIRYRSAKVKICDLWSYYLKSNSSLLRENIKDCKSYKEIMTFYESIASGVSMSDKILAIWDEYEGEKFPELIHELTVTSYNKKPVFKDLPTPQLKIHYPDIPLTLEEFKEMVESISLEVPVVPYEDLASILRSTTTYLNAKELVLAITKGDIRRFERRYEDLVRLNVVKVNGNGILEPDKNFNILLQILEE